MRTTEGTSKCPIRPVWQVPCWPVTHIISLISRTCLENRHCCSPCSERKKPRLREQLPRLNHTSPRFWCSLTLSCASGCSVFLLPQHPAERRWKLGCATRPAGVSGALKEVRVAGFQGQCNEHPRRKLRPSSNEPRGFGQVPGDDDRALRLRGAGLSPGDHPMEKRRGKVKATLSSQQALKHAETWVTAEVF